MGHGGGDCSERCSAEEVEDDLSFFPASGVVARGVHEPGVHEGGGGEDRRRHGGTRGSVPVVVEGVGTAVDISVVGEEWTWEGDGIISGFPGQRRDDCLLKEPGVETCSVLRAKVIGDCQRYSHGPDLDGGGGSLDGGRAPRFRVHDEGEDGREGCCEVSLCEVEGRLGHCPHSCLAAIGDIDLNATTIGEDEAAGPSESPVQDGDGDPVPSAPSHHVAVADQNMLEEKIPRKRWRKMEEKVRASVQRPPPGPFSRVDLLWEAKSNVGNGKRRETQKATIPWDRLEDFLEGEMSGRQHPCTFVEVSKQCMKNDVRKQIRAESALQEIRYV